MVLKALLLHRALGLLIVLASAVLLTGLGVQPGASDLPVAQLTLGYSSAGRPITALRVGFGPRKLVLVGDTHGWPEANTYELANRLADYYQQRPDEVPPEVRLYIIPTLNPDGLVLQTRFNGRGVDLNRNMNTNLDACPENDWSRHVYGARGIESDTGGLYPESEPESRIIRDFLLDAASAIFYHSSGGDVFPAFCEHAPSIALAKHYAQATGYRYDRYWPHYMITGGMHDWAGSLGIAAITPELTNGIDADYEQNLAAVQAVLRDADQLLPLPEDRIEQGQFVPAPIWRYWKMHGGMERFGPPLAPPEQLGGRIRQVFERAVLEVHPELVDTPGFVQLVPLGRLLSGGVFTPEMEQDGVRFFPESGHTLRAAFEVYWEQSDGQKLFGPPISEEFKAVTADGKQRTVQYFERAVFAYHPEDGSVRLEPLGWAMLVRERMQRSNAAHQIR